ncbi:class I SAM-dependent methyltransferase [Helicobacter cetorum]|uniref:class I SAM-dependent methyltransferase n=1 Tax=Helicobacter cetorum TaxID=138563 RepID=UPI0013151FD3|nr:class I SAM-dependent methyltransferase [Helicobacter cetorum]
MRKIAINTQLDLEDIKRRVKCFTPIIANKKYLDVGAGNGAMLESFRDIALEVSGVEPQNKVLEVLQKSGYEMFKSIDSVPNDTFEVVSLFHVFGQLSTPLDDLKTLYSKIKKDGRIIIEVPHAKDFLLQFLKIEAFFDFTFRNVEQLIVHTRESLVKYLSFCGFKDIVVQSIQRYPLANHLYWLNKKAPKGHVIWNFLRTQELDSAYADLLKSMDMSDTLIVYATK